MLCSESPAAAAKEKDEASSPRADHPKVPQDPHSSEDEEAEPLVRDLKKAKGPAAQSQGQAIGPFLLTQESEAFSEDVSSLSSFFLFFIRCAVSAPDRSSPRVYVQLV